MLNKIDNFYLNQQEGNREALLAIRDFILELDNNITAEWKYGSPFFCYKRKMFCYFWIDKKLKEPYIGIVEGNRIEHPLLEKGDRTRIKILRISPSEDIPIEAIGKIMNTALDFYRNGIIKTK